MKQQFDSPDDALNHFMSHGEQIAWGIVPEDLQPALDQLTEMGDTAVPPTVSIIQNCATGRFSQPYWWNAARPLCKVLAQIGTADAKEGLLTILKINSQIAEFDGIRAESATQLAAFNDPGLVTELTECLNLPNAPVLAIKNTIETLGSPVQVSPNIVLEEGRQIESDEEAIRYFAPYVHDVVNWSPKDQGAFYFYVGRRVKRVYGEADARPLFAASLEANPSTNAVAWQEFPDDARSAETASQLVEQYPLNIALFASTPTSSVTASIPASVEIRSRKQMRKLSVYLEDRLLDSFHINTRFEQPLMPHQCGRCARPDVSVVYEEHIKGNIGSLRKEDFLVHFPMCAECSAVNEVQHRINSIVLAIEDVFGVIGYVCYVIFVIACTIYLVDYAEPGTTLEYIAIISLGIFLGIILGFFVLFLFGFLGSILALPTERMLFAVWQLPRNLPLEREHYRRTPYGGFWYYGNYRGGAVKLKKEDDRILEDKIIYRFFNKEYAEAFRDQNVDIVLPD